ncbi:hypothetical protein BDW69DRAFT_179732 [Aspergillus filifer]
MTSETCEVPIMLDLEGLTYEDIAKLNPFYEEYKTLWDDLRDVSASENSLCIDRLSDSSSLPSIASNFEFHSSSPSFPSSSMDVATSSPSFPGVNIDLASTSSHDLESSQAAIFDDEEGFRRPLSLVRECIENHDSGIAIEPVDRALGNVRSSAPLPKEPKYKSLIGLGKKFKQQVEGIAVEAVDIVKAHPLPFYGPRH